MDQLVPITDEQAKAIQEVAKASGAGMELIQKLAGALGQVLGTIPEDIVGLLAGDYIRARRVENAVKLAHASKERLKAKGVGFVPPPLPLLGPILNPASEEERPELVELWTRLLAAAMDPARTGKVRQAFIDTVKKMDPMDALVFDGLGQSPSAMEPSPQNNLAHALGAGQDEVEVSLLHLIELGVIRDTYTRIGTPVATPQKVDYTVFGRELVRVLRN